MSKSRWTALLCAFSLSLAAAACSQTDAGVTTKVKSKLAADDTVKAYQIDVDTRNKVVTLSGNVDSSAAKIQAIRLARETEGVTNVVDNLVVQMAEPAAPPVAPASAPDLSDPGITAAVKTKLLADPDVSGLKIDVDTANGIVTLSGTVKTPQERDQAVRIATDTTGVKSVNDKIKVGR